RYIRFIVSFFFNSKRRHQKSKRDWSSDLCSSDLSKQLFIASISICSWISTTSANDIASRRNKAAWILCSLTRRTCNSNCYCKYMDSYAYIRDGWSCNYWSSVDFLPPSDARECCTLLFHPEK